MKYTIKDKIIIIILIICMIFFTSFDLNLNLGKNNALIADKDLNTGYEINLIDSYILIFIIFNAKTYNDKFDKLLINFYEENKNEIDNLRSEFLQYLSSYFKGINYNKGYLFYYYNIMTLGYDIDEIQYKWFYFKRKKIDEEKYIVAKNNISYQISCSFDNYTYSRYFALVDPNYKIVFKFLINNQDKISEILLNSSVRKRIHDFFNNFLESFGLNDVITDYYQFYGIEKTDKYENDVKIYFNWYSFLYEINDNKPYFLYQGLTIPLNNFILIRGIAEEKKLCYVLLHELGHLFFVSGKDFDERDSFINPFIKTVLSNSEYEQNIEINDLYNKISLLYEKNKQKVFFEVYTDTCFLYFCREKSKYNELANKIFETNLYYPFKNNKGSYNYKKFDTNIYLKLIDFIVNYSINNNIKIEEFMFLNKDMSYKYITELIDKFIKEELLNILKNNKYIYIEY